MRGLLILRAGRDTCNLDVQRDGKRLVVLRTELVVGRGLDSELTLVLLACGDALHREGGAVRAAHRNLARDDRNGRLLLIRNLLGQRCGRYAEGHLERLVAEVFLAVLTEVDVGRGRYGDDVRGLAQRRGNINQRLDAIFQRKQALAELVHELAHLFLVAVYQNLQLVGVNLRLVGLDKGDQGGGVFTLLFTHLSDDVLQRDITGQCGVGDVAVVLQVGSDGLVQAVTQPGLALEQLIDLRVDQLVDIALGQNLDSLQGFDALDQRSQCVSIDSRTLKSGQPILEVLNVTREIHGGQLADRTLEFRELVVDLLKFGLVILLDALDERLQLADGTLRGQFVAERLLRRLDCAVDVVLQLLRQLVELGLHVADGLQLLIDRGDVGLHAIEFAAQGGYLLVQGIEARNRVPDALDLLVKVGNRHVQLVEAVVDFVDVVVVILTTDTGKHDSRKNQCQEIP